MRLRIGICSSARQPSLTSRAKAGGRTRDRTLDLSRMKADEDHLPGELDCSLCSGLLRRRSRVRARFAPVPFDSEIGSREDALKRLFFPSGWRWRLPRGRGNVWIAPLTRTPDASCFGSSEPPEFVIASFRQDGIQSQVQCRFSCTFVGTAVDFPCKSCAS